MDNNEGGLKISSSDTGSVEFFMCANTNCNYGKIDDAFTYDDARSKGWNICVVQGTNELGAYCPECSSQ